MHHLLYVVVGLFYLFVITVVTELYHVLRQLCVAVRWRACLRV